MLKEVLRKHYANYTNQSVENIKRDAKGLLHIISDYEGRVVFELLQNAFDRADKNIRICIKNGLLYVANDGTPFTYVLDFDYENGDNTIRGDFQSICSVYTSSKTVSSAIGNKGIGFKSVFSIAKKQNPDEVYPTRSVDIFTKGQFIDAASKTSQMGAFRLYEMIRQAEVLTSIFNDADLKIQQEKIRNAQKEYPDTGIPGYYFPIEIDTQEAVVQDLFAQGYCTVIAIELEDSQIIGELIKQNLVQNGIHFEFIQLKHQNKPFQVSIALDEEHLMTKEVKLNNPNLIHCTINDEKLIQLAQNAGIDVETINIGLYLRADDKGKLYNYLPTDVASPFPFVDFHADFRTTLNRKNINWDGAVGEYNKALLQACIELLFTLWKPEDLQLNTTYINNCSKDNKEKWHFNFLKSNFKINSETAKIISLIFNIDSWNYRPLVNWIGANTKVFFENKDKAQQIYEEFYKVLIDFSRCIASDYYQKKHSKVEHLFSQLKESFNKNAVIYLPEIISKEHVEVFFEKDKKNISTLLDLKFTTVEIDDSYEGKILKRALNIKDASDINEYLRFFRQTNLSGVVQIDAISEQQQIELLQNVYSFYIRKQERDSTFCERYANVLDVESREKNSLKNQARFSISTLFLKVKGEKYKPAQLCCIEDIDEEFRKTLNLPDDFFSFLGVSPIPFIKVYDQRIYVQLDNGIDYIPGVVSKNIENDRIDKNIVLNCFIHLKDKTPVHPALINDNHSDIFSSIKNIRHKELRPVLELLQVKKYDSFSQEYFFVLKEYLEKVLRISAHYDSLRVFYASTFQLFCKNNVWLIFTDEGLKFTTTVNFSIFKTKMDIENAINQKFENFLYYEADKGLYDERLVEKVIELEEYFEYNDNSIPDITTDFFKELIIRIPYLLCEITNDNQSDRNYLDYDYNILETIATSKVFKVDSIKVVRKSKVFEYNYITTFFIKNNQVFITDDSNKNKSKVLSYLLFNTYRFSEKIEILLYNRSIEDLFNEYNNIEINILKKKYDISYQSKRELFIAKIVAKFPEVDISEDHWNFETSNSIQALKNVEKFDSFRSFFVELKYSEDFKDYDFGLDIIYSSNEIEDLKVEISQQPIKNEELDFLYHKLSKNLESKNIVFSSQSDNIIKSSNRSIKKKVIKNIAFDSSSSEELETIGSNGEHEVLNYFVNKYYQLDTGDRKVVLNSIFELIKGVVDDIKYYEELKDELLINLSSNDTLKTLIPYLYITNKYKYSYFDLVGFEGVDACFVEVKTTSSNRRDFYISQAEIDCALKNENYQIVRVNSEEIIFLGNPIEKFKDQLNGFQNSQYKLTFTKYKIEII
ncbi:protein of unknown function [Algoriella xinjiangensis]|uniref:Protein NO VEIN C-terminal domain-containing protein n=1 Tax=Algoriella xinjiangensis TaxID=684065 RepID=A0A1I4WT07_9FLAO|nr:DUF3883 domain-containing protein [Algoriella xinjiangensis]SFN16617.1 protein of unknown function [Algoriella xinjiangensis]